MQKDAPSYDAEGNVRLDEQGVPVRVSRTQSKKERFQAQNRELAMDILRSKLWEMEIEKQNKEIASLKLTQVGRGMRAEKIRTYNFPQDRLTDHRIAKSWHNLPVHLEGGIDDIINSF